MIIFEMESQLLTITVPAIKFSIHLRWWSVNICKKAFAVVEYKFRTRNCRGKFKEEKRYDRN